ncbi:MAG: SUF system NifU family Fe-S cluster assembly protein [Candidatus Diapherotrites archaeon]|nr:SUF system NifU family Fe-S cluster assembly protein [Candidatus Diapherotrites archaeon]
MSNELYSDLILELYENPSNKGKLSNPTLFLQGGNPVCGDKISFYLNISNNIIQEISFEPEGCAISTACASVLTELIKGKQVSDVLDMSSTDIFEVTGTIMPLRIKCALLGLTVVQKGLKQWLENPTQTKIVTGLKI